VISLGEVNESHRACGAQMMDRRRTVLPAKTMCEVQSACMTAIQTEADDSERTFEQAFHVFITHVAAALVGTIECPTLAALACTTRAASVLLHGPVKGRQRAVFAAGCLLYARTSVNWLVRPSARLDDFIRLALYDSQSEKVAEIKLSRVQRGIIVPLHPEWQLLPGLDNVYITDVGHIMHTGVGVALWRCASPGSSGTPRQTIAGSIMSTNEATRAVYALLQAGFRPLRRRGFYNAGNETPLWGRP